MLATGYLNDKIKTDAAFLTNPPFIALSSPSMLEPSRRRMYKTGDLMKMNEDGTYLYVGRRDRQVKINGQRIELGEIESSIRTKVPKGVDVVVDILSSASPIHSGALAAFFDCESLIPASAVESLIIDNLAQLNTDLSNDIDRAQNTLSDMLPPHMVPSVFIALRQLPVNASGKLDRKRLQTLLQTATPEEIVQLSSSGMQKVAPRTPSERTLRELWCEVLGLPLDAVGVYDHFSSLGGDSIVAIRLAHAARDKNVNLSVATILRNPKLSEQAKALAQAKEVTGYEPMSLVRHLNLDQAIIRKQIGAVNEGLDVEIQDILPLTSFQMLGAALNQSERGIWLQYWSWTGSGECDVARFQTACKLLVARLDILRTVFVPVKDQAVQVVLAKLPVDIAVIDTDEDVGAEQQNLQAQDRTTLPRYGQATVRFTIIQNKAEEQYRLVFRISHAQYDGISLNNIWALLEQYYSHPDDESIPGQGFATHMMSLSEVEQQASHNYWRRTLEGSNMTTFVARNPPRIRSAFATHTVSSSVPHPPKSDYSFSILLKAAWAYVLAQEMGIDDIVFGYLVHGRQSSESFNAVGPCINVVPVRVQLQHKTPRQLLRSIHRQQLDSLPYEQTGFREIMRECTKWPNHTFFGSWMVHQDFGDDETGDRFGIGGHELELDVSGTDSDIADVFLESEPDDEGVDITIRTCENIMTYERAQRLLDKLCETIQFFTREMDSPLMTGETLWQLPAEPFGMHMNGANGHAAQPMSVEGLDKIQQVLLQGWREVLGHDTLKVAPSESFFNHGGDIVASAHLAAYMQREGYAMAMEDVLTNPSLAEQANCLAKTA